MLFSMLIRLAMVAVTAGVVFWIGWTLPTSQFLNSDKISKLDQPDTNVFRSTDPLPQSQTASEAVIEKAANPVVTPIGAPNTRLESGV